MARPIHFSGLLCVLAALGSVAAESERIIGGSPAPSGEFPFAVHLFKNDSPYCGGTLIDTEWVVTAAHCVASASGSDGAGAFSVNSASSYKVAYGSNSASLGDYVEVESITVNAGFDPVWYTSDIALLKIKSNSDLVSKTQVAAISDASIGAGQTVINVGWGQTSNDNTNQASTLMYAGLVTADDATCKQGAGDWNGQNGRYVCTAFSTAPGIGNCFADSGGPLLLNSNSGYSLLGLVSFDVNVKDPSNTKCAQEGNISYFTRVSSYLSFISSTTGISQSVLVGNATPVRHSNDDATSSANADSSTTTSSSNSSSTNGSSDDSKPDDSNKDGNDSDNSKDGSNDSSDAESKADSKADSSADGKTTDKSSTTGNKSTKSSDDENNGGEIPDLSDGNTKVKNNKGNNAAEDNEDDSHSSSASSLRSISVAAAAFILVASFF